MRFPAFALGGLLLAAALPGLAQTVPAEPATELLPTAGLGLRYRLPPLRAPPRRHHQPPP